MERLKSIYNGMKYRCYCKKDKSYSNYGSRGITICDEWLNDYETFKSWAIQNGYEDNLTIDRIDNNNGYCPENCRWVTKAFNSGYTSRWGKDKIKDYMPTKKENCEENKLVKLIELRKQTGQSKAEFGKMLGVTASGQSYIENGQRKPNAKYTLTLMKIFKLDVDKTKQMLNL